MNRIVCDISKSQNDHINGVLWVNDKYREIYGGSQSSNSTRTRQSGQVGFVLIHSSIHAETSTKEKTKFGMHAKLRTQQLLFLVPKKQLYKGVSVRPSVGCSVRPSADRMIHR